MPSSYRLLAIAIAINAVVMFVVMYAMLADLSHFHANLNRLYMTVMMVSPMVVVMLIVMRSMYPDARRNRLLMGVAVLLFGAAFWAARTQTPIGNTQFLRSMIPHHSSAIVMCTEADLEGAEILALCEQIVRAQREEIAQMTRMLAGTP